MNFMKGKKNSNYLIWGILVLILAIYFFSNDSSNDVGTERWTTGNLSRANELNLDVDTVMESFQSAESPAGFEKQVNEIYTGEEIISIHVEDQGQNQQVVTLFIDQTPANGEMDEEEKILSLNRKVEGEQVAVQRTGYGPYAYYSSPSPFTYGLIGAGLTYWALSRPYTTPVSSYSNIQSNRASYRQTPAYQNQVSKTQKFSQNFNQKADSKYKNSPRSFKKNTAQQKPRKSWFNNNNQKQQRQRGFSRPRRSFRGFGRRR